MTALRLDPKLVAEVRALTPNLTEAIEDGLRLWLKHAGAKKEDALTPA
jgi:hypothetical protein